MIYFVTRFDSHHVVTVAADTAEKAAENAVVYRGFSRWEGVELRVTPAVPVGVNEETVVVYAPRSV